MEFWAPLCFDAMADSGTSQDSVSSGVVILGFGAAALAQATMDDVRIRMGLR
jgi:hypothetical protein